MHIRVAVKRKFMEEVTGRPHLDLFVALFAQFQPTTTFSVSAESTFCERFLSSSMRPFKAITRRQGTGKADRTAAETPFRLRCPPHVTRVTGFRDRVKAINT